MIPREMFFGYVKMKYRMYIDEVGNSDLEASDDPNHRYLSLTGIILNLDYVSSIVYPEIERLKREYFGSHPDEPIILHRKKILNKKHPFGILRKETIEKTFNNKLLGLIKDFDYVVLTTTIDKAEHKRRYQTWRFDPYHYCLTVLVERFVMWLRREGVVGDVLAESRGGKEDIRLKDSFEKLYLRGIEFISPNQLAEALTSAQLKIKPKSNNISGLQLADLLAHPSFRASLKRHQGEELPDTFGGRIARILEDTKYLRSPDGIIDGWGRKWLP